MILVDVGDLGQMEEELSQRRGLAYLLKIDVQSVVPEVELLEVPELEQDRQNHPRELV